MTAAATLRRLSRRLLLAVAHDATAATATRSALVIAPHPDDETLGCGATIRVKLAAGSAVTLVLVTDGGNAHRADGVPAEELARIRRREMDEAATRLGLDADAIRWLGIEDGAVSRHEAELEAALMALVAELAPAELYATCAEEPHPDHAVVGRVARRVSARTGVPLREYSVWLWHGWPVRRQGLGGALADLGTRVVRRRASVVATAPHRATKLHALQAHRSQIGRLPDDVLTAAAAEWELFL